MVEMRVWCTEWEDNAKAAPFGEGRTMRRPQPSQEPVTIVGATWRLHDFGERVVSLARIPLRTGDEEAHKFADSLVWDGQFHRTVGVECDIRV